MTVATGTQVEALSQGDGRISIQYRGRAGPGRMVADAVFFVVGWPANLSQLSLGAAGIKTVITFDSAPG
jgi:pyruvate/2-oxoglutarate dehydrogenase complex dihydrolipoamide dehydrogenase (E3) component